MATDVSVLIKAVDQATTVFQGVEDSAKGFASRVEGFMAPVNKIMGSFTAVLGLAAGSAGIKAMVDASVNWNTEAVKLSKSLGVTTEEASVFNTALRLTGIDSDTAMAASMRLARTLSTNEEKFTALGVSTRDSSGHLRSATSIMADTNTALANMKSGMDRNVAANDIYGRSWNDVQSLLKLTPEMMAKATEEANKLGLIVGPDGAMQAKKYKESMNEVKLVTESLKIQMGAQLLPVMKEVALFMASGGGETAKVFGMVIEGVAKSVMTLGQWLGLMGYRLYALATGQFKQFVEAGKDFNAQMEKYWGTWGDKGKSAAPVGNQLAAPFVEATAAVDAELEALFAWQENMIYDLKLIDEEEKAFREAADERQHFADALESAEKRALDARVKDLEASHKQAEAMKLLQTELGILTGDIKEQTAEESKLSGLLDRRTALNNALEIATLKKDKATIDGLKEQLSLIDKIIGKTAQQIQLSQEAEIRMNILTGKTVGVYVDANGKTVQVGVNDWQSQNQYISDSQLTKSPVISNDLNSSFGTNWGGQNLPSVSGATFNIQVNTLATDANQAAKALAAPIQQILDSRYR